MAFCKACGNEVLDTAVVCVKCGSALKADSPVVDTTAAWPKNKMIGFGVLSFFLPFVGAIMGIIALFKESRRVQGIILLAISLFATGFWRGFMSAQ
jgi:uncharacterized membrane protein YvbJ